MWSPKFATFYLHNIKPNNINSSLTDNIMNTPFNQNEQTPMYIGYVLKRYPRFSETFVVNGD